jgi:endonuclease-3
MTRVYDILNILRTFIEPRCELNYRNSYELLIAVVLSAQTTDKHVNQITIPLFEKYDDVYKLSKADVSSIKEIIKPLGLADVKSRNISNLAKIIVEKHNGIVPNTFDDLINLPGVGRKTAQVVLAEGFKIPALPVDTHVERVSKRLGLVKEKDSVLDVELNLKKIIKREDWILSHHLLLLFGRYYCKKASPMCENCKLKEYCKDIIK